MNSEWFVVLTVTGLVVRCECFAAAARFARGCGGVLLNPENEFTYFVVAQCRDKWNK